MSAKSATNATDIYLFYFLIALHIHHLYYSLVFQEHRNNVSRETLLPPSPTPFALQYGVISLQHAPFSTLLSLFLDSNSPLFRPQKHIHLQKRV